MIISDHTYGLLQEAAKRRIPSGAYVSGDYVAEGLKLAADSGIRKLFPHFELHLTGLYSITDLMLIARLPQASRDNLRVRFARDLNIRDFYGQATSASSYERLDGTVHEEPEFSSSNGTSRRTKSAASISLPGWVNCRCTG